MHYMLIDCPVALCQEIQTAHGLPCHYQTPSTASSTDTAYPTYNCYRHAHKDDYDRAHAAIDNTAFAVDNCRSLA